MPEIYFLQSHFVLFQNIENVSRDRRTVHIQRQVATSLSLAIVVYMFPVDSGGSMGKEVELSNRITL